MSTTEPAQPPLHVAPEALSGALERLRSLPLTSLDLDVALFEITATLPCLVGADGAGLLLVDEEQVLRCVCATDPLADALEVTQEETGRGPCVAAFLDGAAVAVDDVTTDPRWPALGAGLRAAGIGALLGMPVEVGGAAMGSLNLYAKEPRAWDEDECAAIAAFARLAGRLLATALLSERHERLADQLQHALDVRLVVERAVGVVMALEDTSAESAFAALRDRARRSRRPLRRVADDVVRERRLPS